MAKAFTIETELTWDLVLRTAEAIIKDLRDADLRPLQKRRLAVEKLADAVDEALVFGGTLGEVLESIDGWIIRLIMGFVVDRMVSRLKRAGEL